MCKSISDSEVSDISALLPRESSPVEGESCLYHLHHHIQPYPVICYNRIYCDSTSTLSNHDSTFTNSYVDSLHDSEDVGSLNNDEDVNLLNDDDDYDDDNDYDDNSFNFDEINSKHPFFDNFPGLSTPLYSDSEISISGAVCCIMKFCITYKLSYSAISKLLKLLQLLLPSPNRLPTTLYKFKKYFNQLQMPHVYSNVCSSCQATVEEC